jgi:hypothetical protein
VTLDDLDQDLVEILSNTRAASTRERYHALNAAYQELCRTLMDVRSEQFLIETGDITVPHGQVRIALTGDGVLGRAIVRVRRITSLSQSFQSAGSLGAGEGGAGEGGAGGDTTISVGGTVDRVWTPMSIASSEFLRAEQSPPGDVATVLYDLIFPLGVPTLAIAPALATDDQPLLSLIYFPSPLTAATSVIEPVVGRHSSFMLAHAMERLLRAVNDGESDRWGNDAREQKSRIIQNVAPKIEQGTQAVGSALYDMGYD